MSLGGEETPLCLEKQGKAGNVPRCSSCEWDSVEGCRANLQLCPGALVPASSTPVPAPALLPDCGRKPSAASGCTHLSSLEEGGCDSWAKFKHRICGECFWVISIMVTMCPPLLNTHSLSIPGVRLSSLSCVICAYKAQSLIVTLPF